MLQSYRAMNVVYKSTSEGRLEIRAADLSLNRLLTQSSAQETGFGLSKFIVQCNATLRHTMNAWQSGVDLKFKAQLWLYYIPLVTSKETLPHTVYTLQDKHTMNEKAAKPSYR